jgi:hypothetical protein
MVLHVSQTIDTALWQDIGEEVALRKVYTPRRLIHASCPIKQKVCALGDL